MSDRDRAEQFISEGAKLPGLTGIEKQSGKRSEVQLLDAAEAVEFLGGKFSQWTLYDLVRKKKIPHCKIAGRIFFRPQSLIDWLNGLEAVSMVRPEPEADPGKIRRLK